MRQRLLHGVAKLVGISHAVGMWVDDTGPGVKTLTVMLSVPGPLAELWLERLAGDKQFGKLWLRQGTAVAQVAPGSYSLVTRGKTNSVSQEYDIEITTPPSASWKPNPKRASSLSGDIYDLHQVNI